MRFVSTRGGVPPASLREALFRGLAPDGGLYLPERLERFPEGFLAGLRGAPWEQTASAVARHLVGPDIGDALEQIVADALDFPLPLVAVSDGAYVLELFHGPTLAFKDVGARFMARLMGHLHDPAEGTLTVLVATSGDTGSAVAHAFLGMPGVRTVVLFPEGRVSPVQEQQLTMLGGNVRAVAVDGAFDDCQRLAKEAFADRDLRERDLLTSANSINVGRLLPQIFYYVHAWAQLAPEGLVADRPAVFSVPSGNFGNLTAGLLAKAMGLPAARFLAATNANDVVPRYLETGRFEPRSSRSTLSSAMDVGDPSNFRRILYLYGDDRERIRADVAASAHTDVATRRAIADVARRHGYLMDPHTAVGWLALEEAADAHHHAPGVVLATAHPAKFPDVVEEATGRPVAVPDRLARALEGEPRVTRISPRLEALREILG